MYIDYVICICQLRGEYFVTITARQVTRYSHNKNYPHLPLEAASGVFLWLFLKDVSYPSLPYWRWSSV